MKTNVQPGTFMALEIKIPAPNRAGWKWQRCCVSKDMRALAEYAASIPQRRFFHGSRDVRFITYMNLDIMSELLPENLADPARNS